MKNYFRRSRIVPAKADYVNCSSLLVLVEDMAPCDSNVDAIINRLADGTYHCMIYINAAVGKFYVESNTFSLVTSIKQAQGSMLRKLADWKEKRFSEL